MLIQIYNEFIHNLSQAIVDRIDFEGGELIIWPENGLPVVNHPVFHAQGRAFEVERLYIDGEGQLYLHGIEHQPGGGDGHGHETDIVLDALPLKKLCLLGDFIGIGLPDLIHVANAVDPPIDIDPQIDPNPNPVGEIKLGTVDPGHQGLSGHYGYYPIDQINTDPLPGIKINSSTSNSSNSINYKYNYFSGGWDIK